MPLSARQWQVVELVGDGLSNEKIAEQLFLSLSTVKTHLNDIYEKTGAVSRANLIAIVAARQMTGDLCPCGTPWADVPPGHTRIRGTDGTEHCGDISVTDPPEYLAWTTLESLK
jgi:DNA-binding CsgD family transcriptional regulator